MVTTPSGISGTLTNHNVPTPDCFVTDTIHVIPPHHSTQAQGRPGVCCLMIWDVTSVAMTIRFNVIGVTRTRTHFSDLCKTKRTLLYNIIIVPYNEKPMRDPKSTGL